MANTGGAAGKLVVKQFPTPQKRVLVFKLSLPVVITVCRKMLKTYGVKTAYKTALAMRDHSGEYDHALFNMKETLAALGIKEWPGKDDFRDMEHYLAAFDESQLVGFASPGEHDNALAALAKMDGRFWAGEGMMVATPAYSAAKAICQHFNLPIEYLNGARTSAPDGREVMSGTLGAMDAIRDGTPLSGDLAVNRAPGPDDFERARDKKTAENQARNARLQAEALAKSRKRP
jgi:hypothetical protein